MRLFFGLFAIFSALTIATNFVNADDAPVSVPVNEWQIEPFYRSNGFASGECVMKTQYDNNLEVQFKGKGRQLNALRVTDIANKTPNSPIKGYVGLGLDNNSYGLQSKSVDGQVDASLISVAGPVEQLMSLDKFRLRIGVEDYFFSTDDFAKGYEELLLCQGVDDIPTVIAVDEPIRVLPKVVKEEGEHFMPMEPVHVVQKNALLPQIPNQETVAENTPVDLMPNAPSATDEDDLNLTKNLLMANQTWTAAKGESLSNTLQSWSKQANVKANIDLDKDVTLPKDFIILAPFDIAVNQLIDQTSALTDFKASAVLDDGQGVVEGITGEDEVSDTVVEPRKSMPPMPVMADNNWRALEGTDLRKVLMRWATREGVDFIWDADQMFLIKKSMKQDTDFVQAVSMVVNQFDDDAVKPVATLNIDPETKRKALIIKSNKS